MKKPKRFVAMLLVLVTIMAYAAIPASATSSTTVGGSFSGSKQINHSGSCSITSYSVRITYGPNVANSAKHCGSSSTSWMGASPYNADQIVHRNIVSASGVGGFSASSSGGGVSTSSSQMVDEMSVNNTWRVHSTFDYSVKRGVLMLSTSFGSSGRVKIGSNFFNMST